MASSVRARVRPRLSRRRPAVRAQRRDDVVAAAFRLRGRDRRGARIVRHGCRMVGGVFAAAADAGARAAARAIALGYGIAIGLDEGHLITALLVTQFVGFPASIAYGRLGARLGARRAIGAGIAVYAGVTVWSYFMASAWEFYVLAVVVGLVQGGVQSLSRSLFARMVPATRAAEFFGFYNMLGKFAAVIGPLLIGLVALWTGSSRIGVVSIVVMFVAGGLLLRIVDEDEAARVARER